MCRMAGVGTIGHHSDTTGGGETLVPAQAGRVGKGEREGRARVGRNFSSRG
jgi:hypothetical protein